jgi:hypothetical protein
VGDEKDGPDRTAHDMHQTDCERALPWEVMERPAETTG